MSSAKALEQWNDILARCKVDGSVSFRTPSSFDATATIYGTKHPRIGIYEHTINASKDDLAIEFNINSRDWAQKHNVKYVLRTDVKGGSKIIRPGKNDAHLKSGDCILMSLEDAHKEQHLGGWHRFAGIYLPEQIVDYWLPHADNISGMVLPRKSNWGNMLSYTMRMLASQQTVDNLPIAFDGMSEHICGLLALSVPGSNFENMSSYKASVYKRLIRTLYDNQANPNFNIDMLSSTHNIPKPTLYKIFANAGTTFVTELMSMRLNRARQLLEDRRLNQKTIAEISSMSGFAHPVHFTRVFKKKWNLSPSEFRNLRNSK